jgi:hypothetical protein
MKYFKLVYLVTALIASASAYGADLSYNFIQLDIGNSETDVEGFEIDGDSFGVWGSFEISDDLYVVGGYSSSDFDFDLEQTALGVGLGVHKSTGVSTSVHGEVLLVRAEVELGGFGSEDDNGYGFNVGVRHLIGEKIELDASFRYLDIFDDTETGISIGGRGYMTETTSLGLFYSSADDTDGFNMSLRFDI